MMMVTFGLHEVISLVRGLYAWLPIVDGIVLKTQQYHNLSRIFLVYLLQI